MEPTTATPINFGATSTPTTPIAPTPTVSTQPVTPSAPVQMTRAQYQAQYGAAPVTPAPVQMTHAEYMAKYGGQTTSQGPTPFQSPLQNIANGNSQDNIEVLKGNIKGIISSLASAGAANAGPVGKDMLAHSDALTQALSTFDNKMKATNLPQAVGMANERLAEMAIPSAGVDTTVNAVTKFAGNRIADVVGATTGAGASSVKEAFGGGKAFTDAMRGNVNPDQIVQTAQDAVQNIANARRTQYQANLAKITDGTQFTHDFTPIQAATEKGLTDFGITKNADGTLNFDSSKFGSTGDQTKVTQIIKDVQNWANDSTKQTTASLDTLKQRIDNYVTSDTKIGAFANSIKNSVQSELNKAPGYKEMTAGYAKASQLLDDIKSATGAGGNAKVDTVFTKMTTALRGDRELRLQLLNELQASGHQPELMSQIAGANMSSYIPKGLMKYADISAGAGILGHFVQPQFIPMFLATSPRIVGEFLNATGMGKEAITAIVNAVQKYGVKGSVAALPKTASADDGFLRSQSQSATPTK